MSSLSSRLERILTEKAAAAQRDWRAPGLSVGIVRDGEHVFSSHLGVARLDPADPADTRSHVPLTDDTRVMIGSITKTFTAVLVMSLRDEGLLGLGDTLGRWLPHSVHRELTLRQLLSHSSGLQREPDGHLWEDLAAIDRDELVAGLERAEQVLPEHHAFHYSNLAYGLLGEVVTQVTGQPWERVVSQRILGPLAMTRTTLTPGEDRAYGYQVDPYAGTAAQEPLFELGAMAPLGGLWSSMRDMLRYAAFVADPARAVTPAGTPVLAAETLEEMCRPLIMTDTDRWRGAYGLGFGMLRLGERVHVGHGGAMPGFLSGLRVRRPEHLGAFVVATCSSGAQSATLAAEVLDAVLDEQPHIAAAWTPQPPLPELSELLGVWFSEGESLTFYVEDGQLMARAGDDDDPLSISRFTREGPDLYRVAAGRERGERLELVRAGDGTLEKLYFATYAVTRRPLAFADLG